MSDYDALEAQEATASQFRSLWGGFPQELPPDPRGKYFRAWAEPRPEEITAVAGAVQTLENELLRLAEIASVRHSAEVEQAQQPQTEATFGPPREAARLARLQAAQAALKLAVELLAVDSPEQAQAAARQAQESEQAIAAWKHSGRGWFESRSIVKGYYAAQLPNEQTGDKEWWWLPLSFGPYRYFRWREPDPETGALTTRTWYLGKQEQANRDDPTTTPTAGDERPVDQPHMRRKARLPVRRGGRTGEAPRGGRPAKLTPEEVAELEAWLEAHPSLFGPPAQFTTVSTHTQIGALDRASRHFFTAHVDCCRCPRLAW